MALTRFERKTAEQTANLLQAQGYKLDWEVPSPSGSGERYDLVAKLGDKGTVYEFTRQSHLSYADEKINRLRQLARADGFDDFRHVVVPDAIPYEIKIEGLETEILRWVQARPIDDRAQITRIFEPRVEVMSAQSGEPGMKIQGTCGAEFVWHSDGETYDCPLYFDLQIGLDWRIQRAFQMRLDLNDLAEILPDWEP